VVFVNGVQQNEPYAVYKHKEPDYYRDNFPATRFVSSQVTSDWWADLPKLTRNGSLVVPEDSYFVLGDNRNDSLDSRYWGLVPRENIIGSPLLIYFSVRRPGDLPAAQAADGKINGLAERLWQLPEMPRWNRTFRLVK
jgi:signal peptidase I